MSAAPWSREQLEELISTNRSNPKDAAALMTYVFQVANAYVLTAVNLGNIPTMSDFTEDTEAAAKLLDRMAQETAKMTLCGVELQMEDERYIPLIKRFLNDPMRNVVAFTGEEQAIIEHLLDKYQGLRQEYQKRFFHS